MCAAREISIDLASRKRLNQAVLKSPLVLLTRVTRPTVPRLLRPLGPEHFRGMAIGAFVSVVLAGCAGLNVSAVGDDTKANGIRYYEPANFLLVYSDAPGSVKTEIITLPDTTRKMVAKPHTVLSKNKQTLTFSDGVLTASSQEADATAIPSAVIAVLKSTAAQAISKSLMNAPEDSAAQRLKLQAPKLYKIIVNGDTIELVGTDSGDTIHLPIAL